MAGGEPDPGRQEHAYEGVSGQGQQDEEHGRHNAKVLRNNVIYRRKKLRERIRASRRWAADRGQR
jgi:hypothetical protein